MYIGSLKKYMKKCKYVFIDNLIIEKFNFYKKLKYVICGKEVFNIVLYFSISVGFFLNFEID